MELPVLTIPLFEAGAQAGAQAGAEAELEAVVAILTARFAPEQCTKPGCGYCH